MAASAGMNSFSEARAAAKILSINCRNQPDGSNGIWMTAHLAWEHQSTAWPSIRKAKGGWNSLRADASTCSSIKNYFRVSPRMIHWIKVQTLSRCPYQIFKSDKTWKEQAFQREIALASKNIKHKPNELKRPVAPCELLLTDILYLNNPW